MAIQWSFESKCILGFVFISSSAFCQETSQGHSDKTNSVEDQGLDAYKIPDECPEWIKKLEGVPECPKGEGRAKILPESFPIGVFVINAGPGAHMPTAEKLAEQILEGAESGKPPIIGPRRQPLYAP